jgi:hypothetical protein
MRDPRLLIARLNLPAPMGRDEMREEFKRALFGDDEPLDPSSRPEPRPEADFVMSFLRDAGDIVTALSRVERAGLYLAEMSPATASIGEILYHAEKLNEETYIVQQRAKAMLTRFARRLVKRNFVEEATAIEAAKSRLTAHLEDNIIVRGHHVHQHRMWNEKIGRIEVLQWLVKDAETTDLELVLHTSLATALTEYRASASGIASLLYDACEQIWPTIGLALEKLLAQRRS